MFFVWCYLIRAYVCNIHIFLPYFAYCKYLLLFYFIIRCISMRYNFFYFFLKKSAINVWYLNILHYLCTIQNNKTHFINLLNLQL